MKLLLMADGNIGEAIYDYLVEFYAVDLAMIVTVEDNALRDKARVAGFASAVFETGGAFCDVLRRQGPSEGFDLGVLAWWPKIVRQPLVALPKQGFINLHPSFLPFNRGKHYNFWALVEQSPYGVSLHFVDASVDTGDIVAQSPIAYDWTDTGASLYHKAQREILDLFRKTYPRIRTGTIRRIPQDLSQGSFHMARELEPASRIDLDAQYHARDLLNLLRARIFPPHPACHFFENGKKYEVRIEIKELEL